MDAAAVDAVRLNFNPSGLLALNAVIGLMMFGIALDMKLGDFTRIIKSPKAPAIGLGAQFILLPAFTFLLTLVLPISPSIALGMILVASCPGGNLSNMMTYLAGGNAAVSVSMTAVSTAAAVVMTPLNLAVWGSLNPATAPILRAVSLSPIDVFFTIVMILGIPMALGMLVGRWSPRLVDRVRKPFKIFAVCVFLAVVGGALAANWHNFIKYVGLVALVVALHNAMALSLGYSSARLFKLPPKDVRAVAIEVGIQNSALGLILVFDFFGGLGGMAIITAWWGVWHIISGLTVASVWSRRPVKETTA
ncbi:MAG: bile acid:sodium symporter family protein [Desulfarculaceae bacterium]|nr:bile acid:sodium symporter family protein [Desulfarculaceae bacterium]MCF8047982.1 bile acid:sodium symporter family protein [Desulfarculaceae bacterium]MCF8064213.1 bile acid:sodium symporter family protein [Desulfarculaceae bacterium]MCF8098025.1 bile acid:sodium symporter family protein [Desulfarculaceae bacterium]MCF8122929.1 bile acid:sodium symporter family protein [Desulfarculaceae bacterium]